MSVLMLVIPTDAPVPPSPGRWMSGETVRLVDPATVLSPREANPPQSGGGFYQITVIDRTVTDPDIREYLEPLLEFIAPDDPVTMKRRRLELNQTARDQLGNGDGRMTLNYATLQALTDDAENP